MTNHKATQTDWVNVEHSAIIHAAEACILELRSRIEQLEAQANHIGDSNKIVPPPVATDEELKQTWLQGATLTQGNRAIYNLGIKHGQASSREVAEPAPVAGEVKELVAELRIIAAWAAAADQFSDDRILTRAADTLQRLSEQEAGR
jgi:hypothetical protein